MMNSTLLVGAPPAAPAEIAEIRGPDAEAADRLYPAPAAKPAPPVDARPEEKLYPPGARGTNGATPYGKDVAGAVDPAVNAAEDLAVALNPAGSTPTLKTEAAELTTACAAIGLDRHDLETFAGFARANVLKPPTEDELRASQLTALRDLRAEYRGNFDEAFQAARDLVKSQPKLSKLLSTTRLGDNPHVVLRLAELGLAARARGKL